MKQSDQLLAQQLEDAARKITVGARYRHYKNKDYRVIGLAYLETTTELAVIYQADYGKRLSFIRPLANWLEKVEVNGKLVRRFAKI